MEDYRARFVEIYNKNITRPGADRLLSWLETTDFFTAPASTRYHGACEPISCRQNWKPFRHFRLENWDLTAV